MSKKEKKLEENEKLKPDVTEQAEVKEEASAGEKTEETDAKAADKIAELEKANAELKDQYLRKCADFDNFRKRMQREKQEAFDYANTNLLTDLIAVLDDFDRALAAGVEADGSAKADLKPVVDGIKMINKQLRGLLEAKYNLTSYGEKGDAFNHDLHEAIASNPGPVKEPVCSEVYLKGYKLKERVIRPAKVMVQMPDGTAGEPEAAEPENK